MFNKPRLAQSAPAYLTHLAACYAQLDQMVESHNAFMTYEREKPDDVDFSRYAGMHFELCMGPEDAEHWMVGYCKAGLIE